MQKFNIITHVTTHCNYDCSYCDVIKDKKILGSKKVQNIIDFALKNAAHIWRFKFFWGEPLLAFSDIKRIIEATKEHISDFEIVTNTSLLRDEVGEYFEKYFFIIFLSIDSENSFDYEKVDAFIQKYHLKNKLYFNLIISPGKEEFAYEQFERLVQLWYGNFNILPVYYKKVWTQQNLLELSKVMKKILDLSQGDKNIHLYGFQQNAWYNNSLLNRSIFIDIDGKLYYTDFVSTFLWEKIKSKLFLGKSDEVDLSKELFLDEKQKILTVYEQVITRKVEGQRQLHKLMDYFSNYLNHTSWTTKD